MNWGDFVVEAGDLRSLGLNVLFEGFCIGCPYVGAISVCFV